MSVEQMRDAVRQAYPGEKWAARVAKMSDDQIIAVYYRLLEENPRRLA